MLTIQSNLKIQNLETLSKTLIKPDIINFGLNKVGGGYTDKIADKVIAKLSKLDKDKTIIIINDITLQMADKLLEAGYKNIYLAFGSFNKDGTVSKDKIVYNIMKAVIENNIKEKLNAITLEEIFNMKIKFDGIIANPPYGKIGANITKKIIDTVDFTDYINLLPANDYKRNSKDLFNYQSDMESIKDGFADASVTTNLAKIHKTKVNNMTADEFEISQYSSKVLQKYFKENITRKLGALANYDNGARRLCEWTIEKTFIMNDRTPANKTPFPLAKSESNAEYLWNRKYLEDSSAMLNYNFFMKYNKSRADKTGKTENHFVGILFNTAIEKTNLVSFIYSELGNKFIATVLHATHKDGWLDLTYWFPKVDWTRSWTVEEILKDYGYTEDEIKEVMEDLKNFKGMDD